MSSLSINTSHIAPRLQLYVDEVDSPYSSRSQSFIVTNDDEFPEIPKTRICTEEEVNQAEAILSGRDAPQADTEETELEAAPMSVAEKIFYYAITAFFLFFISLILLAVLL